MQTFQHRQVFLRFIFIHENLNINELEKKKILNQKLMVFQEILTSNHTRVNDRAASYFDFVKIMQITKIAK